MTHQKYTINCDLGEGGSHEASIIPWIDVASIACGGHFGDGDSIKESLELVRQYGKKAGAHPSYPDHEDFGRKTLGLSHKDLLDSIHEQLNLYVDIAESRSEERRVGKACRSRRS